MRREVLAKLGGVWGVLTIAALVAALVFSLLSAAAKRDAVRLAEEGVTARAVVVDKREHRNWRVGGTFGTDYILRYRFDADRQGVEGRDLVSQGLYDTVRVGTAVQVRYWLGDARVSEVVEVGVPAPPDVALFLSRVFWGLFVLAGVVWVVRRRA